MFLNFVHACANWSENSFVVVHLISILLLLDAVGPHVDISIVLFISLNNGNAGARFRMVLELHLTFLSVLSRLIHIKCADLARRVSFWALLLAADDDRNDGQD